MRNHQKAILLMLLFALAFAGCSSAKRQKAADISISGAQEEFPSIPETIPETDAPQEAELGIFKLWGDRIFEKCGIGRDEGGDGGKTLEIRGKRRLSARDGGANYQQS